MTTITETDPALSLQADPDAASFRAAMSRLTATVAILTAGRGEDRVGVTITAACSLSDAPPSVLVCLHRDSSALETIRRSGHFALNYLSADQEALAGLFAGRGGLRGHLRFSDPAWRELSTGAPVHPGALCAFDCELTEELPSPTHAILVGRVRSVLRHETRPALAYSDRAFVDMGRLSA